MNVEVEVNGIKVVFNICNSVETMDTELYKLLRKGDVCEVNDGGVKFKGEVQNIIRLSKGRTLFSVRMLNNAITDTAIYEEYQVTPVDPVQCALRLTAMDMVLRKYEPTGLSTNTYSM